MGRARQGQHESAVNNVLDDVTWTKGKHTITMGLNFRYNRNNTSTFTNAFPAVRLRRDGIDRAGRRHRYVRAESIWPARPATPTCNWPIPTAVTNASAMLLGILNDVFVTYQYNKSGQVLPQGTPQQRSFIA